MGKSKRSKKQKRERQRMVVLMRRMSALASNSSENNKAASPKRRRIYTQIAEISEQSKRFLSKKNNNEGRSLNHNQKQEGEFKHFFGDKRIRKEQMAAQKIPRISAPVVTWARDNIPSRWSLAIQELPSSDFEQNNH